MFKKNVLSALLLLTFGATVQMTEAQSVFEGANQNKVIVLSNATGKSVEFMSDRYISGSAQDFSGFVYDIAENKVTLFPEYGIPAYFGPNHYIMSTSEFSGSARIFLDGKEIELTKTHPATEGENAGQTIWAAQTNGDRMVGLTYELNNHEGRKLNNHVGVVYDARTGDTIRLLHSFWPLGSGPGSDNTGYGSRADCISEDGTVVGGHGTWPIEDIFSTNSTVFWDLVDIDKGTIYTYAIEDKKFCQSSLNGTTTTGDILVGYNDGIGIIIHYDRANKSFTLDTISALPGYQNLGFSDVSDNGSAIGYIERSSYDPYSREAVIYTKLNGLIKMKEYLYEYYDINMGDFELGVPSKISADGTQIAGFTMTDGFIPWYISLKGDQILPRARKVTARAAKTLQARIDWQLPLAYEQPLTGFNIYRDDETQPLNGATLLSPTATTFLDEELATDGEHTYHVECVYGEQKSGKSASNRILVLAAGSTYPVQRISHETTYNHYVTVFWGMPSSDIVNTAVANARELAEGKSECSLAGDDRTPVRQNIPAAKSYKNPTFDYIDNVDMAMFSGYGAAQVGDNYFLTSWKDAGIQVVNKFNEIDTIYYPNFNIYSMEYVAERNRLYIGNMTQFGYIDLNNPNEVVGRWKADSAARHMAYIDDYEYQASANYEAGKGVLAIGGSQSCLLYTLDGYKIGPAPVDFTGLAVAGTAYHDGKLYVASNTGEYLNEIYTFDFKTGKLEDGPVQVIEDPAAYDLLSANGEVPESYKTSLAYAAELCICHLDDGTVALGAVYQCSYITCQLMLLELESDASLRGYDLYRSKDGGEKVKLNDKPLTSRRYNEELTEAGSYVYSVQALGANGASQFSPNDTVVIADKGNCDPPTNIKAVETNEWVSLTWNVPESSTGGYVGFTIYRDGEEIAKLWETNVALRYTDQVPELGTYTYTVESFLNNGCIAADSVKITLTGEGVAKAPFGLHLDYKQNVAASSGTEPFYDVTAKWELPMFEDALAIYYGSGEPTSFLNLGDETTEYWAGIGWDVNDLKLYEDLYIVGMEYLIGDNVTTLEGAVFVDNVMVTRKDAGRPRANTWETIWFDQSFRLGDAEYAVDVTYHTTYPAGNDVAVVDVFFSKIGYSDLLSADGETWGSLYATSNGQIAATWCIRALVVRKRDLDAATTNGVVDYKQLEKHVMRFDDNAIKTPMTLQPLTASVQPSAKAPLQLQGFNLFRTRTDAGDMNEIKLNGDDLMTAFEFTEKEPLPQGEYAYRIEAVYSNTSASETKYFELRAVSTESDLNRLALSLYPNPATEVINIDGEFSELQIRDLGGRTVLRSASCQQIQIGHLPSGTYFLLFKDENGNEATYKIVVR